MPASIASTNASALVLPPAAATIAGPGHRPPSPQPMPNTAAPAISGASMSARTGTWNRTSNHGRARRRIAAYATA